MTDPEKDARMWRKIADALRIVEEAIDERYPEDVPAEAVTNAWPFLGKPPSDWSGHVVRQSGTADDS